MKGAPALEFIELFIRRHISVRNTSDAAAALANLSPISHRAAQRISA